MLLFVILAILVAVAALPVVDPELPVTLPVRFPVNTPAIAPVPVIVGEVKVLLVSVCDVASCTMLLFVMLAIFVAVAALPVVS